MLCPVEIFTLIRRLPLVESLILNMRPGGWGDQTWDMLWVEGEWGVRWRHWFLNLRLALLTRAPPMVLDIRHIQTLHRGRGGQGHSFNRGRDSEEFEGLLFMFSL